MRRDFDAALWRRAQELFEEVADLLEDSRRDRLAEIQTVEPAARELVGRLLEHDEAGAACFEEPLLALEEPAVPDLVSELVGPYRLIEVIGKGGAGVVYRAEREGEDFRQQVAVKVLHRGFHADSRRRFHLERRILARLEHPTIARLIDGGTTDADLPYVVMEWVDGESITDWCARQDLGLRLRLKLFCKVGEAVSHAHRNLVVHRDLKPSNILVNREGTPKLLDFGIAKLLQDDAESDRSETIEARWLTPGYASPEQVLGEPVTASSDVYSLGLLLYELLAGDTPQPKRPTLLMRFVQEDQLPPPSRWTDPGQDVRGPHTSARGGFGRRLRGDLDAIVLQALQRDPQRRYGSAEALVRDLRRHLDGRPVAARRAGALYRAAKFVGRHVIAVAASALFVASILAFAITAELQSRELERERDLAERRRVAAETVTDVLVETFELLDPAAGRERDVRAKAILDQGRLAIERRFAGDPEVRAELQTGLGRIYRRLAYYEESAALLEAALDRRLATGSAAGSLGLADSLAEIGRLLLDRGELGEAETTLRSALATFEQLEELPPGRVAATLRSLASTRRQRGDFVEAERTLRQALEAAPSEADLVRAELILDLAGVLVLGGRPDEGLSILEEAVSAHESALGPDHPRVADASHAFGTALMNAHHWNQARAPLERAFELRLRYYGEEHPETLSSLANLAGVTMMQGRFEEATSLQERVLELDLAALGPNHPYVATDHLNLGISYYMLDRSAEAAHQIAASAALRETILPPDSIDTAIALDNLGLALTDLGRFDEAEASHRKALEIRRQRPEAEWWNQGDTLVNLAHVALARASYDEGFRHLAAAEEAFARGVPDSEAWLADRLLSLRGEAMIATGALGEAEDLLLRGFEGLFERRGPRDRHTRDAARRWAHWLELDGRHDDARAVRDRVIAPMPVEEPSPL